MALLADGIPVLCVWGGGIRRTNLHQIAQHSCGEAIYNVAEYLAATRLQLV